MASLVSWIYGVLFSLLAVQVSFLIIRLTGFDVVQHWSWWWVMSPSLMLLVCAAVMVLLWAVAQFILGTR